jgi:hypothetical protein
MITIMKPSTCADPVQSLLLRSGYAALLLCALAAVTIPRTVPDTLIDYYFFHQDVWLLSAAGLMLCVVSRFDLGAGTLMVKPWQLAAATLAVALLSYAGTFVVMERYAMARDEVMAVFAADHFQRGDMARAVPPGLRSLANAMMPWGEARIANGVWTSSYLPVNSLLRAAAGLLGDQFIAGPILLAVGCYGLWSAARRIWPKRPDAATVAVILALTSTQIVTTAMTPFAMTAHFALNAIWIACYLRRDARGHAAAIVIGFAATGLHQIQVHVLFVSGFIVWDFVAGRRWTALLYACACAGYLVVWDGGYTRLVLTWALGPLPTSLQPKLPFGQLWQRYAARIGDLQPISSLARFAGWQNMLLLPLAFIGARDLRDGAGRPTVATALAISCAVGLVLMLYQGLGYGYRYLHGLIPCFCLLAAGGWVRLSVQRARPMPAALLWIGCGFALLFTAPVALTMSHAFLHPYAHAYRVLRAAPADYVLVDGRGGGLIEDLVRIDGPITRPILLDMSFVSLRDVHRLCATSRVMIFDQVQARPLGIRPGGDAGSFEQHLRATRALLAKLRCGRPVPIG